VYRVFRSVGGGVECLVGHGVERVEDEQRRGGVFGELGAAGLAPVPARDQPEPAGDGYLGTRSGDGIVL
jgi:hypothetical protein